MYYCLFISSSNHSLISCPKLTTCHRYKSLYWVVRLLFSESKKHKLLSKAVCLSNFPLFGKREGEELALHGTHSPFKDVTVDGWEPLQHHRVRCVAHNLGGKCYRPRLPGGLPALVHQIQVTVHSGDLIGREGVRTVVICKQAEGEISTKLHKQACERRMTSPGG